MTEFEIVARDLKAENARLKSELNYLWGRFWDVYKEHGGILNFDEWKTRELEYGFKKQV